MIKLKVLPRSIYTRHILEYSEYSKTKDWASWYSKVAPLKGRRIINILLEYKTKDSKVLDLGCGIGLSLSFIGQVFKNSVGCDISENSLRATKEILEKHQIKIPIILCQKDKLPFKDNCFDIVTFIEVIEHVENPDAALKEIKRVLKPDGILHITTANKYWPIEPHYKLPLLSYFPKSLANRYLRLSRRGLSYDDINLPSYKKFHQLVGKYFKVQDITLDVIKNYKKYGLDKERGFPVPLIARFLSWNNSKFFEKIAIRFSLGWLFIARPK